MSEGPVFGESETIVEFLLETDERTGETRLVTRTPLPQRLELRKLVGDLLKAVDNEKNYPKDSVELQLKMIVTEQDLKRILSEFTNDASRAE
jgi:hypothetical protein